LPHFLEFPLVLRQVRQRDLARRPRPAVERSLRDVLGLARPAGAD
jgi:hypothetical protein